MDKPAFKSFGTDAIHAGQPPDAGTGAVMVPISLATTFYQRSPGQNSGYEYARSDNPTRHAFEDAVAKIENGKFGCAFSSGCGATASLLQLLKSGDEVIAHEDMYGGTFRLFHQVSVPYANLRITTVDLRDPSNLEAALSDKTRMVWLETPTNPLLTVLDIERLAAVAHARSSDIIVVTDNTFATPYFQRPLDLGCDFAMHSVSKYINGHSDVIMGAAATNSKELYDRLRFVQKSVGAVPSPFDCYLAMRGLKTMHVRMQRHNENAAKIARYLVAHDKVEKVSYPGLEEHPQREIIDRQMRGGGGMITIWLRGGIDESRRFLESLKLWLLAESLGGVESLIEHPAIMTHASVPAEQRAQLGIDDSLVRMSVGIEDVEDLIADLEQALAAV